MRKESGEKNGKKARPIMEGKTREREKEGRKEKVPRVKKDGEQQEKRREHDDEGKRTGGGPKEGRREERKD